MREVMGGNQLPDPGGDPGTCAWHSANYAICNISKATAQSYAAGGGNWCCESCPSNMNCQ